MKTPIRHNPKNGFTVARIHYSLDPAKDQKWVEEAKKPMTERAWNREYEIDYTYFAGKPFFPEFQEYNIANQPIIPNPGETLYRGWDFGFHRPCVVVTRLNRFDQWELFKCILGQDEGIREFGMRVRNYCLANFPGCRYIDAADPAGNQSSDKSEATSAQMLNALGIYPQTRKQPKTLGAEIIRQKLAIRVDGKPGLIVDPREQYIIDAFRGGLHYPEVKEGHIPKEEYEKDGFYDHCFSPFTNIICDNGTQSLYKVSQKNKVLTRGGYRKVVRSWMTGYKKARLYVFTDGSSLVSTPDHEIFDKDRGFIPIDDVGYYDNIERCVTLIDQIQNRNRLSTMAIGLIVTLSQQILLLETTTFVPVSKLDFIYIFGKNLIARFLRVIRFIIGTATHSTIVLKIWLWLLANSIMNIIQRLGKRTRQGLISQENILSKQEKRQRSGTSLQKEGLGTQNTEKERGRINLFTTKSVRFAVDLIKHIFQRKQNIVAITAKEQPQEGVGLSWKSPEFLIPTYNLFIQDNHEYFANGILVHNCGDSLRYIATEMFTIIGESQQGNNLGFVDERSQRQMGRGSSYVNEHAQDTGLYYVYDPLGEEGF